MVYDLPRFTWIAQIDKVIRVFSARVVQEVWPLLPVDAVRLAYPNQRRSMGPPRARDLDLRAEVDVTGERNIASQIAFGGADRRALAKRYSHRKTRRK